jgi:N-acetylglucosaminyldiphosphoundecaprenol N-acetyl-beta-D-mannosaminyltransferase
MDNVTLLGIRINRITLDELLSFLAGSVRNGDRTIISYINVHALNLACESPRFREFASQSDLSFCDGVGIKLAAALTRQKLDHRFTPPDFIERLCEAAATEGWRIYFLGAKPGIAARAADNMRSKFPGLQVEAHHGHFDMTAGGRENSAVVQAINGFHPDILIVGFGMPLQEQWILDNMDSLDVKVLFPAGALFDYLSGSLPRAPRWMTDHGLEWLSRLAVEPRRLWRRYLIGIPLFYWRILLHHLFSVPLPG